MKTNDVLGIGNAMMDFLLEVDDSKLTELGLTKGQFHSTTNNDATRNVKENIQQNPNVKMASGGSVANTMKGIACLGGKTLFCSKVGTDSVGDTYIQELEAHGITSRMNKHGLTTGYVVSFITPDTERTFLGDIAANNYFSKEDVSEEDIMNSKVLHLEGYQFENPAKEAVLHALELAKKHGTKISIDLSDPGVIARNLELFKEVVKNYIDIIFLNEEEAEAFTGLSQKEALREVAKIVDIAVVKIGKEGSLVCYEDNVTTIPGYKAEAVDTTGAGDSYAAGFLYGYCNNWNVEKSGKLGSLLAARVVEHVGVKIKDLNINEIKSQIEEEEEEEMQTVKIGIIGGSGLNNPDILQDAQDMEVETPYGKPSSPLKVGKINGVDVVLLARHGRGHTITPTQVNNRANIHALKEAGCTHILATTACGSLREEIGRGDFVILDQFIDFTRHRKITFHDEFVDGDIKHTPMAEPFDKKLRKVLNKTASNLGLKCHPKGTVVTIEGPRFSTKAESHLFRSWNADVINMSTAPECILANEIGLPYAAVAMSTDFDCWKEGEVVSWEEVLKVFKENVGKVTSLLMNAVQKINSCPGFHSGDCCSTIEEENEEAGGSEASVAQKAKPFCEFDLKSTIRTIPNWPKEGIMFRDITTMIENPDAFAYCIKKFAEQYKDKNIDKIAGIESRGFIFGAALAKELHLPFVLIRKKGKLPGETVGQEYNLEYGTDKIEVHTNSINAGENVLVIDDLLATGGTCLAACKLVEKLNGNVASVAFVIDLPDLGGTKKLAGYDMFKLVNFEGE